MLHRRRWKPARSTIDILFNCFIFFSTTARPVSALPLRSVGFASKPKIYSISPFAASFSLRATKDCGEDLNSGFDSLTMIVRVRSNLGTMKLVIKDEENATESTIRVALVEELERKTAKTYKLTQELSFDPAGSRQIHTSQSLGQQGIRHGSMVYCRVEEGIPSDTGDATVEIPMETKSDDKPRKKGVIDKKIDVIDLIESSDEDEIICENNQNNAVDGNEVQVVIPSKSKALDSKKDASRETTQSRKRQRTVMDGQSSASDTCHNDNSLEDFQIASYNVWFGPPDAEAKQVFPQDRMTGIVESLQKGCRIRKNERGETIPLLFIGLQELTTNLVQYLSPEFKNIGFRLCTQPLGGFGPSYGIGIAVPEDLPVLERRFVPYGNSIQARGILYVRTSTILFVTTHLESWTGPQSTGSKEREVQLIEAAQFCQDQFQSRQTLELAVIAGDLNWDDERKRKSSEAPNRELLSLLSNGWNDAGSPFDFTYDAKENPMLNGNLRRRFDRCIYLSRQSEARGSEQKSQNYQSIGLQKIGKESIRNLTWNKKNPYNGSVKKMAVCPSDHFGIIIPFAKKTS